MEAQFYSTSEARKILSDLVNQVKYQGKKFSIGRHGETEAILVPAEKEVKPKKEKKTPNIHEHIQKQRAVKNKEVKYDSNILCYEYQKLAKKYNLNLIILFGSHAKRKIKPDSDIDIAVLPKKTLTPQKEEDLYIDLVELLGREDIDLVNLEREHDALLRYEIFSKGKLLFEEKQGLYSHLRMRAYFNYNDFKHYFEKQSQIIMNKLKTLTQI